MILLGIVGTPAAGKSTVAEYLAWQGAHWINADLIARDCLGLPDVRDGLVQRFGQSIVDADGAVIRSVVASKVFGDAPEQRQALKYLESLVHPIVRRKITESLIWAAENRFPVSLLDVPLMFESGWDRCCDAIWCIDADRDVRLQRAARRGWDALELDRREASQVSIATKKRLSNRIMSNDATLEALHEKLRAAWELLATIQGSSTTKSHPSGPSVRITPSIRTGIRHCQTDFPAEI
ncbi:dephospho-CoA kinase [Stieleria varia]|nr:dephospho-CoA kinase [Stieleria varia]